MCLRIFQLVQYQELYNLEIVIYKWSKSHDNYMTALKQIYFSLFGVINL